MVACHEDVPLVEGRNMSDADTVPAPLPSEFPARPAWRLRVIHQTKACHLVRAARHACILATGFQPMEGELRTTLVSLSPSPFEGRLNGVQAASRGTSGPCGPSIRSGGNCRPPVAGDRSTTTTSTAFLLPFGRPGPRLVIVRPPCPAPRLSDGGDLLRPYRSAPFALEAAGAGA